MGEMVSHDMFKAPTNFDPVTLISYDSPIKENVKTSLLREKKECITHVSFLNAFHLCKGEHINKLFK